MRQPWSKLPSHALLVLVLAGAVTAHIRLTYPLARYLDIDFLDNKRTHGPCGVGTVPDKDPITPFFSGETFNITWHLGVPHQGGYKIQILEGDRIVHWLTAEGEWQSVDDVTVQSGRVTLPAGYECTKCTMRVLRQAAEFNDVYGFWSCAEISIKKRNGADINCSGQSSKSGVCECNRLYSGPNCQYKDECWNGEDCNNRGKCITVAPSTYPRKQCFCELGWFGHTCQQESPVKNLDFDPRDYTNKQLAPDYTMHYRILAETEELEVILQAKTNNWVAIGWHPLGLTTACKDFPDETKGRPNGTKGEGIAEEPEPEPEAEAAASGNSGSKKAVKLHVMDCSDILIGTARGSLSRVMDYYTRDRSTPREDEVYGGRQSLTAAAGNEVDGITTILFRRKLKSSHPTDYTISSDYMELIFARGQQQGNYLHRPRLGINGGFNYPFFYSVDEIKYHGNYGQRGMSIIQFINEATATTKFNEATATTKFNEATATTKFNSLKEIEIIIIIVVIILVISALIILKAKCSDARRDHQEDKKKLFGGSGFSNGMVIENGIVKTKL